MADARRDGNSVPTLLGVSNADGATPVAVYADPTTHRLLVDVPGGSGTVTSVSVVTANGVSGSVATATTTPAITLTLGAITPTTVNGVTLTGSGSATLALGTKSLTVSNTLTLAGTDSTTMTFPTTSATIARTDASNTFTGHQTIEGVTSTGATGTGKFVFDTTPTLVTPVLGVATATSVNKVAITAPATSATLTIADGKTATHNASTTFTGTDGKTLTINDSTTLATNSITLGGGEVVTFSASNALSLLTTGTSVMTFPTATDTVVTLAATQTVTNKRITKRVVAVTQSATPVINTDNTDVAYITGLAQAVTSFTSSLSGTPVNGDTLIIDITDNGTGRALTFGTSFEASTVALPTTTVASTKLTIGFRWNIATTKWTCVAVA